MKINKNNSFYKQIRSAGSIACITGASAGIGAEFAKAFAELGFDLLLTARRSGRLEKICRDLENVYGIRASTITADLSDNTQSAMVAEHIITHPEIRVLVNNAGFGFYSEFHQAPIRILTAMLDVHNRSSVILAHAAVNNMVSAGAGLLINVSSMAAFTKAPGSVMYNASKAFLNSFSSSLARELRTTNIRVQALCPGFTHTEFHSDGKLKTFKDTLAPRWIWMNAKDVVDESLAAVGRNRKTVCIPGFKNRFFKTWIYGNPLALRFVERFAAKRSTL